jgi:hypothetical protein
MLAERRFRLVVVGEGRGVGEGTSAAPDGVIAYDGAAVTWTR